MFRFFSLFTIIILSSCTISKDAIIQEPNYNKIDDYIKHYAYSLVFNSRTKQAKWVAYKLNTYQTTPNFKRTNKFIQDTSVNAGTATNQDYYK